MNEEIGLTTTDFVKWVERARVGDRLVYHVGVSADAQSNLVSAEAQHSAALGEVALFQRRVAPMQFEYIAVRINRSLARHLKPKWST